MNVQASTVQEYFDGLTDDRRTALEALRKRIRNIWPQSTEDMAHGMPTYHLNGHALCALASQKHFMAIYLMHYDLLHAFKNDLKVHDCGKSCIRFKQLDPQMMDLLDRVLKYCGSQMSTSIYFGKASNLRGSNGRPK
jgi:uncharacterized protein YdhG (YjbR/CyaY superfamily)